MRKRTLTILMLTGISVISMACAQTAGLVGQAAADTSAPASSQVDAATAEESQPQAQPAVPQPEAPQQPETSAQAPQSVSQVNYPIVDTGQGACYDDRQVVDCPQTGNSYYGQDAQYSSSVPDYTDNGDGTITDNVTGLMWQQSPDLNGNGSINAADKLTYDGALAGADSYNLAGYDDWRLPSIKELYSLIRFDGIDPSGMDNADSSSLVSFIDTGYFEFDFGDTSAGERIIDAQFASSTKYVSTTMSGAETMFGVNFADGRIKGYGLNARGGEKTFYVLYVRGNMQYGQNDFVDNQDGSISDIATGLMWQLDDSAAGLDWDDSLAYCEALTTGGYDDWRLPDAKELQSIVDYSRSPDTTGTAAIDPLFHTSGITNEAGQSDYPAYWSSTTHANFASGGNAAYVSFGRSMGYMQNQWMDVHGAGAQRSDPKSGDPGSYPTGHGPQGDAVRIENYARCVRGGDVSLDVDGDPASDRGAALVGSGFIPEQQGQQDQALPMGGDGPPQEAVTACSGLAEGDVCSINTPDGSLQGTCTMVQDTFACVPENRPSGGRPQ